MAKGIFIQYALSYLDKNRAQLLKEYPSDRDFSQNFVVTDQMMSQLKERAEKAEIKFDSEQYAKSDATIRRTLKALLARDLYQTGSYYLVDNQHEPVYNEALSIINNKKEYNKLLGI